MIAAAAIAGSTEPSGLSNPGTFFLKFAGYRVSATRVNVDAIRNMSPGRELAENLERELR
jgi:hypothetical protein